MHELIRGNQAMNAPRTGRELPDDLRRYKAPSGLGAFQYIQDSLAFLLLLGLAIGLLIFAPYL